jgi:hypothetical protein
MWLQIIYSILAISTVIFFTLFNIDFEIKLESNIDGKEKQIVISKKIIHIIIVILLLTPIFYWIF